MALTAVLPGLFPTALLRDAASTPSPADSAQAATRLPDVVVFSSAPFRLLADLATAGLRQLATLLPTLEQAVAEPSLVPLAYLAKAAGTAAKQVSDGHLALLSAGPDRVAAALPGALALRAPAPDGAAPALRTLARQIGAAAPDAPPPGTPPGYIAPTLRSVARQLGSVNVLPTLHAPEGALADPAQRWIAEAKHLLHRTGDVLDQAVSANQATDPALPGPQAEPQITWALLEIAAAQTQIAIAARRLEDIPIPARRGPAFGLPSSLRFEQLAGATGLIGAILLLALLGLAAGLWSVSAGLLALAGTALWIWRFSRAARGLRLDARP